jgi:hypothetical protein
MGDERPDGWTSTPNFHICYARVWTMIGSHPDGWSGIGNFHISCTRVRIKADWRPDGDIWIAILALRRRASGRMMLGLTGVWTVWHVVLTDWTVVRWASGRDGSIVWTTDREPKSSIFHAVQSLLRVLWIVGSLFTASLHTQVILSRMEPKY